MKQIVMRIVGYNLQVVRRVVRLHMIAMMHDLPLAEPSFEFCFRDKSVLIGVAIHVREVMALPDEYQHIAARIDATAADRRHKSSP